MRDRCDDFQPRFLPECVDFVEGNTNIPKTFLFCQIKIIATRQDRGWLGVWDMVNIVKYISERKLVVKFSPNDIHSFLHCQLIKVFKHYCISNGKTNQNLEIHVHNDEEDLSKTRFILSRRHCNLLPI
jgi:hypothetical protein